MLGLMYWYLEACLAYGRVGAWLHRSTAKTPTGLLEHQLCALCRQRDSRVRSLWAVAIASMAAIVYALVGYSQPQYTMIMLASGVVGAAAARYILFLPQARAWYLRLSPEIQVADKQIDNTSLAYWSQRYLCHNAALHTKGLGLCAGLMVIGIYAHQEWQRMSIPRPESITAQRQRLAQRQKTYQAWQEHHPITDANTYTWVQTQARVAERLSVVANHEAYQQQNTLWQTYQSLQQLQAVAVQLQTLDAAAAEAHIRQHPFAWAQVRGYKEILLALKDQDTAQATSELSAEGNTLQTFQYLLQIYQRQAEKAQKGVQSDHAQRKHWQQQYRQYSQLSQSLKALSPSSDSLPKAVLFRPKQ